MLLKLGTYGLYRFVLPMVPDAVVVYAPAIAVISIAVMISSGEFRVGNMLGLVDMAAHAGNSAFLRSGKNWKFGAA